MDTPLCKCSGIDLPAKGILNGLCLHRDLSLTQEGDTNYPADDAACPDLAVSVFMSVDCFVC
jgi:hypothetical protein